MSNNIDQNFDQEKNREGWNSLCSGTGKDLEQMSKIRKDDWKNPTGATDCIPHNAQDKKALSDVKYGRTE